jgi:predicted ester cyclase
MTGGGVGDQPERERNKHVVRRLVDEVLNGGNLAALDELYSPEMAPSARRWIEPFLASFSDVHMRVEDLIAEDDRVAARFRCSGTHTGTWLGHPATGRRFTDIDEVYLFHLANGRITRAWGLEDTPRRLRQLGLTAH